MLYKDLAPWIAIVITLALSILVPVFTQVANNRFQLKMKEQERQILEKEKAITAYEDFFKYAGGCIMHANPNNISEAGASIQQLYLYLPTNRWSDLDKLYDLVKDNNWEEAKELHKAICRAISKELNYHR